MITAAGVRIRVFVDGDGATSHATGNHQLLRILPKIA
jgi:hypothetical protein